MNQFSPTFVLDQLSTSYDGEVLLIARFYNREENNLFTRLAFGGGVQLER
jgi:hypothetical protein